METALSVLAGLIVAGFALGLMFLVGVLVARKAIAEKGEFEYDGDRYVVRNEERGDRRPSSVVDTVKRAMENHEFDAQIARATVRNQNRKVGA